MSADDDTELRDLVIDSLEKKGVLGRIKAELRATVFLALEENDKDQGNGDSLRVGHSQQELYKFLSTEKGIIALSLVQDFLQQFQLDFSLAVLEPEASSPKTCIPRNELGTLLKLSPESDSCCPLLALLVSGNQSTAVGNNNTDENGNAAAQTTKKTITANGVDKNSTFDIDFTQISSTTNKSHNETDRSILSKMPGDDDPFFDDPLPVSKNSSLFSNYPLKMGNSKGGPDVGELGAVHLSSLLLDQTKESRDVSDDDRLAAGDSSDGEFKTGGFGMSSLRNLPSLSGGLPKPKEGRRQWKDTDLEQRERFMSLTFGTKPGVADGLPSPDGSSGGGDGKEEAADREEPGQASDPLDQDASIEENIEEDLSALADDLLISDNSSKDENVTLDKSVSSFTRSGEYDYMEPLT